MSTGNRRIANLLRELADAFDDAEPEQTVTRRRKTTVKPPANEPSVEAEDRVVRELRKRGIEL
jgi:hypothetical protein